MNQLSIRWQNFRSLLDTGPIAVAPLTILIGANSSGKTSVHAPLLLLKQTLRAQDEHLGLVTKGPLISLGDYEDLVYGHERHRNLTFDIEFRRADPSKATRGDYEVGDEPPGSVTMKFGVEAESDDVLLQEYEVRDVNGRRFFRRRRRTDDTFSLDGFPLGKTRLARAIRATAPTHFYFEGGPPLGAYFEGLATRGRPAPDLTFTRPMLMYLAGAAYAERHLDDLLNGMSYVGPLRERPRRHYELSGETPADVGIRGEHATEILFRRQGTDLEAEVTDWLARFGVCKKLVFTPGQGTFSVSTQRGRQPKINLADLGFGVSQLLPLIVQGFAADTESLVIAEQPEIHLNPKLQSLLANLFVAIAASGRSLLIETHSEHLLLRLRSLVADNKIEASDVALYFVERNGSQSSVRQVPIEENGHIPAEEWPEGFFQEALSDAVALAGAQRQRRARKSA